jgi:hypothetical protein
MAKHIQILDGTGKAVSETAALAKYFRTGSETLSDFTAQVRALSPEAKTELATGAAQNLGWQVVQVAA